MFSGGYETLKILIADDDKTVTKVLERLMVRWGHEVLVASDGRQAQLLLEQNQEIDIAILDWNMPHKTGVDIIREQRTLPLGQQHPFYGIILTSNAEKQCMVQGFDAGADDFITKPFDVEVLKVRLRAGERIIEAQKSLFKRNAKLDEEVKSRTEELSKTLAIAERASEMKSHFLANMSHEIRTPLSGIVSYIELLLYSELTEEQEHDLRTIQSCAHSLRTIINDVLDFSKIEAGRMVIEKAPFNVKSATEEIVELLKIVAQEKEVEVILTYQCGNTKYVGDKIRYQQILSNILSNAIKFSPNKRGVSVLVEPEMVDGIEQGIHLSISDTGIGIHPSKFEKIFESFSQSDTSTTRKYGGTGLGLTIVKKLCELMSGSVWVKSIEGIGSTFHISLPYQTSDKYIKTSKEQLINEIGFENLPVLLAEDNLVNQQAIKRILEKSGCIVTVANNGQEAIDAFKTSNIQCILLDIQMPVMGGEQAAIHLRKIMNEKDSLVPIIALTANVFEQDKERYIAAGIDEILGKPISYPDLFSTIHRLVKI